MIPNVWSHILEHPGVPLELAAITLIAVWALFFSTYRDGGSYWKGQGL